jgi:DNA repair exonuclease SbcCD ATPase subunit
MKSVIFNTLKIRNFLSVGDKVVDVTFSPGLNAITGINRDQIDRRNGVGKSTITDALHFALFGDTIRELKKEHIINYSTSKTCEVSLTFSIKVGKKVDEYEVIRTLEPSKCILYQNQIDITRDSISNTTSYISELIQCNSEVFQNCVVMTVNNTVPFMAKKKVEKRKFIEGIFNLEVFSKMLNVVRDELNTTKKELEANIAREEEIKNMLDNFLKQKEKTKKDFENRRIQLNIRQKELHKEKEFISKFIDSYIPINVSEIESNITKLNTKLEDCDSKLKDYSKSIASLETKNEFAIASSSKIGTDKQSCPVCLRPITEHDKGLIKEEKEKLKRQILNSEHEIKLNESKVSELNILKTKIMDAIKKGNSNINSHNLNVHKLESSRKRLIEIDTLLTQLQQDFDHLKITDENSDLLIEENTKKLFEISEKVNKLQNVLSLIEVSKFVVSEEGVKSFIVKKILKLFNNKINVYLKKLNSNAIVTFNELFDETIVNEKGKVTSYFNYSGAERKVIDLATMFAFIDMLRLQGNVFYNIQFYDELLDTSLDETGVELVLNILNEQVNQYNFGIFIISHRKECTKLCNGEIVYLEKKNGTTTRIPFKVM